MYTRSPGLKKSIGKSLYCLDVKITADFDGIDSKYHEVLLNILTSKYTNQVSFGHNPFSACQPPKKKKWWQFWRAKYSL
jgi:hypothetical protein